MPSSNRNSALASANRRGNLTIEYATEGAPLKSITLNNPRGYKNVKITRDTFRKHGTRFKLSTSAGEVFIHKNVLDDLLEALNLMKTYAVDASVA